jgi:hypothetical protein
MPFWELPTPALADRGNVIVSGMANVSAGWRQGHHGTIEAIAGVSLEGPWAYRALPQWLLIGTNTSNISGLCGCHC